MALAAPESQSQRPADVVVPVFRTDHVSVVLGGQQILFDVSFSVKPREVVALLGANGSGKSTVVRAALGIVPLLSGTVSAFGQPLGADTDWNRIAYVPQRLPASIGIPTTALEVVRAGALSRRHFRVGSKKAARETLTIMGMQDRAHQPLQEMSGGQQQRVLIARALIRKPDLLFLDEPTSGVDVETVDTLVDTLDAMRQAGAAVVVVLHETEPFHGLIDRTVVLRHGRVVHDGAPPPARPPHNRPGHVHDHPHPEDPTQQRQLGLGIGEPS